VTPGAFTLIELLVVIAIIAVLAALIFPAAGAIKRRATLTKVQTEMKLVTTALDFYKEKLSFYPPDNPTPVTDTRYYGVLNQLYYELSGTELSGNPSTYKTLDGAEQIVATAVTTGFGANVAGFVNCTKGAGGDDSAAAKSFLLSLKPGQLGLTTNNGVRLKLLACSVPWPNNQSFQPVPSNPGLNPWRYVSSNPTNNPGAYDLWVDVLLAGKTYRIGNWSQQPQVVPTP
jgi:prepilin-type N-terminal cleavage/methylation domain-containing protein